LPPDTPDLTWTEHGAPRSGRFDDVYFSREGGLEETRAVFLAGCGLPDAWAGRAQFTVGETGFGTGLNILALLQLWRDSRPPGGRLNMFSIEAFPLSRDEGARALEAFGELADLAAPLLAQWPRRASGFHRIDWPDLGATLDLAIGEAAWALDQWSGRADAWFLDGFSPAKNPQMWRGEVLAGIAAHCAPGARAATFTVAGAVRRGLQEAGFQVDKRPGHGRKRDRLEAVWPGSPAVPAERSGVAVIGAGIAGASLVRALRSRGLQPVLVESRDNGAGASGNPAALVTPALDAGGGPRAGFYAQAFARAADLYRQIPGAVTSEGARQLVKTDRDPVRFDAVAASDLFEAGAMVRTVEGLLIRDGLAIRPQAVLDAWLRGVERVRAELAVLEPRGGQWALLDGRGGEILRADSVVLAGGAGGAGLLEGLPIVPVRGQASWSEGVDLQQAAAWGGYAMPLGPLGGMLFGATHDRGRTDTDVRQEDHARNLRTLAQAFPDLAETAAKGPVHGRAALRATTADRMPAAGKWTDGLWLLGGLGSRGFTTAPILAEHVAAALTLSPTPLPREIQHLVDPARLRKT
jgi:tRNA 5-methylaminomethyl-2-thiouridine biosynthesis bifunctional protein